MKILYIVPYPPSLISVRPYNFIRHLSTRGHEVTVLTLYTNETDKASVEALKNECQQVVGLPLTRRRSVWNVLRALPSSQPLQAAYCWQPTLASQLDTILAQRNGERPFDIVHVEHLRGARFGLYAKRQQSKGSDNVKPPVVWDSVDCISLLFRRAADQSRTLFGRWVTRFELERTERYEGWLAQQFDRVLFTSATDLQALSELVPASARSIPFSLLPNGVDLNYFRPDEQVPREPSTLLISGKMSYHANVTMALFLVEQIMPLVWAQRPEVKVIIAGKAPHKSIQALSQHPAVTVTGLVPDLRPYLQQATIAVAPLLYGAGIQNKVLEAMACGTPVIATPQASSALMAVRGRDLVTAEGPVAFAREICSLLDDWERRRAIGQAGRAYVEARHSWGAITEQLERVYWETLNIQRSKVDYSLVA